MSLIEKILSFCDKKEQGRYNIIGRNFSDFRFFKKIEKNEKKILTNRHIFGIL